MMIRRHTVGFLTVWVGTLLAGGALGQTPPSDAPPADPITAMQAKASLTDEDRAQLKTWIEGRIQAIATAQGAVTTAATELRSPLGATASEAFRAVYVESVLNAIKPVYQRVELRGAAQMIALAGLLADPRALDLMIEALGDQRVAVRTAAAVGVRNLASGNSPGLADGAARALTALKDAALKEDSPIALKMMYKAMNLGAADKARVGAAVVEVLDARAKDYFEGKADAWAIDTEGLKLAGALLGQLGDADKSRLTSAVARILVASVVRYADELSKIGAEGEPEPSPVDVETRNLTELQIEMAEELLAKLVDTGTQQRPNITNAMSGRGGQRRDPTQMKIQMDAWSKMVQPLIGVDVSATTFGQRPAGG